MQSFAAMIYIPTLFNDPIFLQYLLIVRLSDVNERRSETSSSRTYPIHNITLHPVVGAVMMAVAVVMML